MRLSAFFGRGPRLAAFPRSDSFSWLQVHPCFRISAMLRCSMRKSWRSRQVAVVEDVYVHPGKSRAAAVLTDSLTYSPHTYVDDPGTKHASSMMFVAGCLLKGYRGVAMIVGAVSNGEGDEGRVERREVAGQAGDGMTGMGAAVFVSLQQSLMSSESRPHSRMRRTPSNAAEVEENGFEEE